jgi:hypothetical protein
VTAKKKKATRSRAKQPKLSDVWVRVVAIEEHLYELHGTRNRGTPFSLYEARRDLADITARLDEQKEVLTELSRTLDRLDDFTREQIYSEVCDIHAKASRTPWHVRCWNWMREAAGDWYFALINLIKGLAR